MVINFILAGLSGFAVGLVAMAVSFSLRSGRLQQWFGVSWQVMRAALALFMGNPPPSYQEVAEFLADLRKGAESRVGVKLRLIGLVLPPEERGRYIEQWMDERNAIRRGEFPKQRFHGLRLLCGAVVQSYETRAHARRSVD
ncbi:hypothetical protein ABT052_40375 [Streptomyces sp. NPDC002766]|uniref:hypothetical protein n=1 Tax=Streptomyces sp. NPDC002766 TaxID=3154429 RepID=UPI003326C92B